MVVEMIVIIIIIISLKRKIQQLQSITAYDDACLVPYVYFVWYMLTRTTSQHSSEAQHTFATPRTQHKNTRKFVFTAPRTNSVIRIPCIESEIEANTKYIETKKSKKKNCFPVCSISECNTIQGYTVCAQILNIAIIALNLIDFSFARYCFDCAV